MLLYQLLLKLNQDTRYGHIQRKTADKRWHFKETGCFQNLYNVFNNLTRNYNRAVRPHPTGRPVEVGVNMFILGIPKVDEQNFEFSIDMYFRQVCSCIAIHDGSKNNVPTYLATMCVSQFWNDDRLRFFSPSSETNQISDISLRSRVWTPDTFFFNQKEGKVIDNLGDSAFFRISNNGTKTNYRDNKQQFHIFILRFALIFQATSCTALVRW